MENAAPPVENPAPVSVRSPQARQRRWPGRLLLIACATWLTFVALHRLLTGRFWLWLLPDLVPPIFYVAAPLLLFALTPLAGRLRRRCALLLTASLLLGIGHSGLNLPGDPGTPPPGALRVFSWNTLYWHQDDDPDRFYRFLKDQRADIYLLQEYLGWVDDQPRQMNDLTRLRREFPGYHLAVAGEQLTLSRFPIIATPPVGLAAALTPGSPWRTTFDLAKTLRTDLRVGSSVLSVYNVHIPAQAVLNENPFLASFYTELRDRSSRRDAQYQGLRADLDRNRNPVLVSGDFNTTAAMGELTWLSDHLTSANEVNSSLYPTSWYAGILPLWQLDWTFTRSIKIHAYDLLDPVGLSDHRAQSLLIQPVPEISGTG
ncbi:endonuclease/exonuclease/phosphatase family protein [Acrocarpospora catenulata]|uniref:endonuclease/exonuclease/phosphatase family protein n=1 Tax=Acrocarpospora catenulata TaxID=2836182 RepID=UPI001BDB5251|nr:endonuclease/exonuclease/phosphatase family protein [Acrocarpospora catenulata]